MQRYFNIWIYLISSFPRDDIWGKGFYLEIWNVLSSMSLSRVNRLEARDVACQDVVWAQNLSLKISDIGYTALESSTVGKRVTKMNSPSYLELYFNSRISTDFNPTWWQGLFSGFLMWDPRKSLVEWKLFPNVSWKVRILAFISWAKSSLTPLIPCNIKVINS